MGALMLLLAALAFGAAACGDDEESSGGSSSGSGSGSAESSEASTEPLAEIDPLTGDVTEVTFDKGFVDALTQLKVAPGPVGDGEISNAGVASFPITGGDVTYYDPASSVRPYVQGEIDHMGSGLSLTAGDTVVELTDFVVDPATSELTGTVSANGKVAAEDALLFNLDGSTLKPLKENSDGSATLEGTQVLLSDDAAKLLNKTFGIKDLKGGLLVGISSITVK
ncbi:hypothetical protein HJD18_00615 [Thermoleophilia bacterium SCSIO 60948]|nr:hypothetical protein HJD18_00615 [Thermoleophilia bacterium SCSIO 60948]